MARIATVLVWITAVLACQFLIGCSPEPRTSTELEDYYFDHLSMHGSGVVYRYESMTDEPMPDELWHFRYDSYWRGNYLHAAMYTPEGIEVQRSREVLTKDESNLLSLKLQYRDEQRSIPVAATINSSNTFTFGDIGSNPVSEYSIEYVDPASDSVKVILTRSRAVVGPSTYVYAGQSLQAVEIATKDILETETEGFTTSEWTGTEIYGFDMGLLYYRKAITDDFIIEYRLAEVIPYQDFLVRYTIDSMNTTLQ